MFIDSSCQDDPQVPWHCDQRLPAAKEGVGWVWVATLTRIIEPSDVYRLNACQIDAAQLEIVASLREGSPLTYYANQTKDWDSKGGRARGFELCRDFNQHVNEFISASSSVSSVLMILLLLDGYWLTIKLLAQANENV